MPCTDAVNTSPLLRAAVPAVALAVVLAGCSADRNDQPEASASPVTSSAVPQTATGSQTTAAPQTTVAPATTAVPQPSETPPATPLACANEDLDVAAGPVSVEGALRRVDVTFTNVSSGVCVLVSYPGADLVTAAGGVLVHVPRRPANSAPHLELQPGEKATADVQASAIDTTTGEPCGRVGTLVVTAPNTTESHLLPVNLPICDATISAVG
ncbi:uncharacterized protein DUF4232 [Mycobacterium sp. BK558]|nr:uncharacterized protein DUF4232 [Mycobacterium sp. BK558]